MHLESTRPVARLVRPLLLSSVVGLVACSGGGASAPGCGDPGDCTPPALATCLVATCLQGTCGTAPAPAGTPLPDPAPGDCRRLACDGAGQAAPAVDDADLPPASPCGAGTCTAGTPGQAPLAPRAPCPAGLCDGAGACVACLEAADCSAPALCTARTCLDGVCGSAPLDAGTPCGAGLACDGAGACLAACALPSDCPGADTECATRTCAGGRCGVASAPAGTPLAAQVAGDCQRRVCDGAGNATGQADDADLPVDGLECTADACSAGAPSNPPLPASTPCAGGVCSGAGACVACAVGADCPSGVCAAGTCQAPACTDGVKNGDESGLDCGGPTCPGCVAGRTCLAPSDCLSGYCFGGLCRADLNGCTAAGAADRTASTAVTVTFPVGLDLAYSLPCLRVRAGTVVTFSGDFLFHPLLGGYAGIPATTGPFVPVTASGTLRAFTLDTPGEYPYHCTVHSLFGMAGAVFVVP